MRLSNLQLRGLTEFRETTSIDFDAIGPGLVALVGKNGAGKTSLMESVLVAMHKALPSRPPQRFYQYFAGDDAFVEAMFRERESVIVADVRIDAVKRTMEAYLRTAAGTTDGKAAPFAEAAAAHFGTLELLLAGPFACQTKKGSFPELSKAERKDLFAQMLGLGAVQLLAEAASKRSAEAQSSRDDTARKVTDLQVRLAEVVGARERLEAAQSTHDTASNTLEEAKEIAAEALVALERVNALAARAEELRRAERKAFEATVTATAAVDEAEDRPRRAESRRDDRVRFLEARKAGDLEPAARKKHAEALARIKTESDGVRDRIATLPDLAKAEQWKAAATTNRAAAEDLAARIRAADQVVRDAAAAQTAAQRDYNREIDAAAKELGRLHEQAARLEQVPCTKAERWVREPGVGVDNMSEPLAGTCPLLADARAAAEKIAAFVPVDQAPGVAAIEAHGRAIEARYALPESAPAPRSFDAEIDEAVVAIATARTADALRDRLEHLRVSAGCHDTNLEIDLAHAAEAVRAAEAEARTIREDYDADIATAAAERDLALTRLTDARAAHSEAAAELQGAEAADVDASLKEMLRRKGQRDVAEVAARLAGDDLTLARDAVVRLEAIEPQLDGARAELDRLNDDVGDWNLLAFALGRDGIQTLEIDAAGPEVSRIANEMLIASYGARFSLTLETLAEKRDGGMKEVFDVRVFDNGAERILEDLSGGEKVVVGGEAIGLAIAIFNARKNAVRWETLWRDETAGALDPENAQAYVRMLRRARELGGFHQVIFVSHQPEVWEAADARIHVANGTAHVQGGIHV